jgi:hypothetical protein
VQRIDVISGEEAEITVIAKLRGRKGVRATAEHEPDFAAGQRLPVVGIGPVFGKSQNVNEVCHRRREVLHGQNVGMWAKAGLAHGELHDRGGGYARVHERPREARKRFFLEKEAKTLAMGESPKPAKTPREQKFFGSFFQKRTACFAYLTSSVSIYNIKLI